MILGASQPAFLPWGGYFGLIDYVDDFVFIDHVQFDRRSRQQRNTIKINNNQHYLTVPVLSKNKRNQRINDVLIDSKVNFYKNHIETIKHNYSKTKYFHKYSNDVFKIYEKKHSKLFDLNVDLIIHFCKVLKISSNFNFSSNLDVSNYSKQELILEICKKKKCSDYISTVGSKDYLSDLHKFNENQINVKFYEFFGKKYNQNGNIFIKNLSILDIIFNLGDDALSYIRESFKITS